MNHRVSAVRNDKYMPKPRVRRTTIRDEVCEKKKRHFHEAYLPYLGAVNNGERSFAGEQLRNGRFALKRTCSRDRVAHRRGDTWTLIASRRSYRPQRVRVSDKSPLISRT